MASGGGRRLAMAMATATGLSRARWELSRLVPTFRRNLTTRPTPHASGPVGLPDWTTEGSVTPRVLASCLVPVSGSSHLSPEGCWNDDDAGLRVSPLPERLSPQQAAPSLPKRRQHIAPRRWPAERQVSPAPALPGGRRSLLTKMDGS
jgi:hypothetical protein